jgi:hypothetical protein
MGDEDRTHPTIMEGKLGTVEPVPQLRDVRISHPSLKGW